MTTTSKRSSSPEGKLVFSFEKLCKATSMSKTVSQAVEQWLVCHSAFLVQLSLSVHLYVTHCSVGTACRLLCFLEFSLHCWCLCLCSQNVKLTDWMLVMCKLAETQMESVLSATDEQQEHIEKLEKQVDKLKLKNTKLTDTINLNP